MNIGLDVNELTAFGLLNLEAVQNKINELRNDPSIKLVGKDLETHAEREIIIQAVAAMIVANNEQFLSNLEQLGALRGKE